MWWRRVVVLAVRMISSTYNNKYAMEELCLRMNKDESHLETTKPMDVIKWVNL